MQEKHDDLYSLQVDENYTHTGLKSYEIKIHTPPRTALLAIHFTNGMSNRNPRGCTISGFDH
jgi:hypothetical protein